MATLPASVSILCRRHHLRDVSEWWPIAKGSKGCFWSNPCASCKNMEHLIFICLFIYIYIWILMKSCVFTNIYIYRYTTVFLFFQYPILWKLYTLQVFQRCRWTRNVCEQMSLNWFCNVFLNATTRNANMFIFPKPTRTSSQTKHSLLPPSQLLITIVILIISGMSYLPISIISPTSQIPMLERPSTTFENELLCTPIRLYGRTCWVLSTVAHEKASLCFEEISNMFNLTCSRKTSFNKICTSTVKQRVWIQRRQNGFIGVTVPKAFAKVS